MDPGIYYSGTRRRISGQPSHIHSSFFELRPADEEDSAVEKNPVEISDGSISENILELLEIIEELDHKEGVSVLDSMKDAYCAVAVESTVKFLVGSDGKGGKYVNAVKRIWRGKIHKMEKSTTAGLISDQLRRWRDDIEAAA